MRVVQGIDRISPDLREAVATIGNFDGVHCGHQAIFREVIGAAQEAGKPSLAITFEPHPKMVLHPERRPFYLITTAEEKLAFIAAEGLDATLVISFTTAFAQTSAESFIREVLWDRLRVRQIYIGHDYTFGYGKEGDAAFLRHWGEKLGFDVKALPAVVCDGAIPSSTRIREAIQRGDVTQAARLLGRFYAVSGKVVAGQGRGAGLGFPTANIEPDKVLLPADGVYVSRVLHEGIRHAACANIGNNPTFDGTARSLEVFLLDFQGDLYGKDLTVQFIERLRGELRFSRIDALIAQIHRDVEESGRILRSRFPPPAGR